MGAVRPVEHDDVPFPPRGSVSGWGGSWEGIEVSEMRSCTKPLHAVGAPSKGYVGKRGEDQRRRAGHVSCGPPAPIPLRHVPLPSALQSSIRVGALSMWTHHWPTHRSRGSRDIGVDSGQVARSVMEKSQPDVANSDMGSALSVACTRRQAEGCPGPIGSRNKYP